MRVGVAIFTLLLAAPGSAVEFDAQDGVVRARDGERVVWENVHDRAGGFRGEKAPGHLLGPITTGGSVYYAIGISLYDVSPETGVVQRRISLPEVVSKLVEDGDGVGVTVAPAADKWTRTYRVGPAMNEVPFFLSGNPRAALLTRQDAEGVLRHLMSQASVDPPRGSKEDLWRIPELRPFVERAAAELATLAERDATNPWYRYWRGMYLQQLGRDDEAAAAFRSVLDASPDADHELLALALRLDPVSPELGNETFRRGLTFLLSHGYEPEMMSAMIQVMIHYGSPVTPGNPVDVTDVDRINTLGERIWELAPAGESTASMFNALAIANRKAGRVAQADVWAARTRAALPFRFFGFGGAAFDQVGPSLNLLGASLAALLLCLFVKGLRSFTLRPGVSGLMRWNPFGFWTRGEIAGFVVVAVVLLAAVVETGRGVAAISRAAAMPLGGMAGNFGHPDAVESFGDLAGPGGTFIQALSRQKAGDLDGAAALYEKLSDPRSRNNLGAIRSAQGMEAEARKLFDEAHAADPTLAEAAHNLARPATGPRVERAKKYGLAGPLLAMPTVAMWKQALAGFTAPWELLDLSQVVLLLASVEAPPVSGMVVTMVYVLLLAAAVVALVKGPATPPRTRASILGWGLGFVVPGTARSLGLIGPLLLTVVGFSWAVHHALAQSAGLSTNILEAIAMPNLTRTYGLGEWVITPMEETMRKTEHLWWILWLVNLAAVSVLEWRRPDPLGPRRPASSPNSPAP